MKKILFTLLSITILFSFCYAETAITGAYLNEYPVKINENYYTPTLPLLNYRDRTYLPLSEFSALIGTKVSFENSTILINTSYLQDFRKLFNTYKLIASTKELVFGATRTAYDLADDYNTMKFEVLEIDAETVDICLNGISSCYPNLERVKELLVNSNILTDTEAISLYKDINNFCVSGNLFCNTIKNNHKNSNYFYDTSILLDTLVSNSNVLMNRISEIQNKIDQKINL